MKRKTTEEFIKEAIEIHGDEYSYESVEYLGNKVPVLILCKRHGLFKQSPVSHLKGHGCPKCGDERNGDRCRKTLETFVVEARDIHGDRYDYSDVVYKNDDTPVSIKCKIHGSFLQRPGSHLRGSNCKKCSDLGSVYLRNKVSTEEFIAMAKQVHGDRYDYSSTVVASMRSNTTIICPEHGPFLQSPSNHIRGATCRLCSRHGYRDPERSSHLYVLKSENMVKIGITCGKVLYRANKISKDSPEPFTAHCYFTASARIVQVVERRLLDKLRGIYDQPTEHFDGKTECFFCKDLPFIVGLVEQTLDEVINEDRESPVLTN